MNRAVYPGSFDPITMGHIDIIKRMARIFDEVIVLIAHAPEKKHWFTPNERKKLILASLKGIKNIRVDVHMGLTAQYLKAQKCRVLIRGIRAVSDFENEMVMANTNKHLFPDIETMTVFSNPDYSFIASRTIKEIAYHGGSTEGLVPDAVRRAIIKKIKALKRTK